MYHSIVVVVVNLLS